MVLMESAGVNLPGGPSPYPSLSISISIIVLLVAYLSLNVEEMADCIWDIIHHGFSNVPKFPMSRYQLFVLIISIDMHYLSTLLTRQNESDKLTQEGQQGG
jgi:hypothetical protein